MSTGRIGDLDSLSEQFTSIKDESESLVEKLFFDGVLAVIDGFPTIDPEALPVVQKLREELAKRPPVVQAHWKRTDGYGDEIIQPFRCSKCGRTIISKPKDLLDKFPYCHCGAIMK